MELSQLATVQMKVSPRLVAMNHVLELSSMELQQLISQELSENPALEMEDKDVCPRCGAAVEKMVCPHCMTVPKQDDLDRRDTADQALSRDDYFYEEGPSMSRKDPEDDFDPMIRVASEMSLQEHLMRELGAVLRPEQFEIAEFLVGNLDERGFLEVSVEHVAMILERSEEDVQTVLKELQSQEPVGIGARDLKECLLLQIDWLAEQGITHPHARKVIENHLDQLGEHKYSRIAQEMRISSQAVSDTAQFIKKFLNPFPAQGSQAGSAITSGYVLPDVIIAKRGRGFEVDVVESKRIFLRINPLYRELMMRAEQEAASLNDNEKKHIQQYVSRARLFMANIDQRRQTLQRIAAFLVAYQAEYLDKGVRHLRPLTRAMVAVELGVHESTVSRATAAKYIMLPSGEVVPLANFFTPSLSAKDVIKDMIEHENEPLTDEQIAERLSKSGINVARRTVAKYREQLGILPSILR
ncbi:MAG: RNA polymerase sigma-54 factor RpoN [uncultured Chloroflexi bacterium]|uniref:RNA polymerase sigma-54 factor RpoN n=1 Tax=uncultured Chloroflexota bacterium TaxID=166587 RepID=A0A6J4HMP7_9CHLR|nr:MAG: RNA polymerase sigma-54 factor RpoN [uncultured Chloroflexota bacterium]